MFRYEHDIALWVMGWAGGRGEREREVEGPGLVLFGGERA